MINKHDIYFDLGSILDGQEKLRDDQAQLRRGRKKFRLSNEELGIHLAVLGSTGSGKSRFLNQLIREHIDQNRGIAVIEPGDLCDDIIAYYAKRVVDTGSKQVLKRIHHLRASPAQCFAYDPFRFFLPKPVHPELVDAFGRAWRHCKVQSIGEIFQAKTTGSSDFEGQPRRQRVLTNVLYGVATEVDGKRLGVGDAQILLDFTHPKHNEVYGKLAGKLPRWVDADFEILHGMKRIEDFRRETESTTNSFRALLGLVLQACLSRTEGPTVDLYRIIQNGECLLLPLQVDPYFSHDQKLALAAVMLHDLLQALIMTPRELRRDFTIVIDEAGELLSSCGEWLLQSCGMLRKHLGRLVIAGQDLSTFRHKELDLAPKLLSQAGTIVTFNQKWPEDTDILSRVVFTGNLDFTPLEHEVERHDGYEWIPVEETSDSTSQQISVGQSVSEQQGETLSQQHSEQASTSTSTSTSKSQQRSTGTVNTSGETESQTRGTSVSATEQKDSETKSKSAGTSRSSGSSSHASQAQSSGSSAGESETQGSGTTRGYSSTAGKANSHTTGATQSGSMAAGESHSVSHKLVHLAKVVREKQETGKLKKEINTQLEEFRQWLAGLQPRQAYVRRQGEAKAFKIETVPVPDPFATPEAQARAVEWIKRELYDLHPYFFTPILDPAEAERRLDDFLGKTTKAETRSPANDAEPTEEADTPHVVEQAVKQPKPKPKKNPLDD